MKKKMTKNLINLKKSNTKYDNFSKLAKRQRQKRFNRKYMTRNLVNLNIKFYNKY